MSLLISDPKLIKVDLFKNGIKSSNPSYEGNGGAWNNYMFSRNLVTMSHLLTLLTKEINLLEKEDEDQIEFEKKKLFNQLDGIIHRLVRQELFSPIVD